MSADALAGTLLLKPGRPPPNIASTRNALARRIAQGQKPSALPDRLAALYALCGDAHRVASRAAIAAAGGSAAPDAADAAAALRIDTLREHQRRIVLDWPAALADEVPADAELVALRNGVALGGGASGSSGSGGTWTEQRLAALARWIEFHLLGTGCAAWLARWDSDPTAALTRWSAGAATPTARRMHRCRDAARAMRQPVRPLRLYADEAALEHFAVALRADPGFALGPHWRGAVFETGTWSRLGDPEPERHDDAWLRLGARLAEVVRLAMPAGGGARALRHGALALGRGEGLGWCEMARGLLLHRVRIDGVGETARVAECDVLAPTEWNFHALGSVAQALARLGAAGSEGNVRLLAAAFDPCVTVHIGSDHA